MGSRPVGAALLTLIVSTLVALPATEAQEVGRRSGPETLLARVHGCTVDAIVDLNRCIEPGDPVIVSIRQPPIDLAGLFQGFSGRLLVVKLPTEPGLRFVGLDDITSVQLNRQLSRAKAAAIGAASGAVFGMGLLWVSSGFPVHDLDGSLFTSYATSFGLTFAGIGAFGPRPTVPHGVFAATPGTNAGSPTKMPVAATLEELQRTTRVADDDLIGIQLGDGTRIRGRLTGITIDAVEARTEGRRRNVRAGEISWIERRIWRHPSWARGALVGASIGAGLMAAAVADERAHPEDNPEPTTFGVAAGGTALMAGIGAAVTRLLGRRDVVVMAVPPEGNQGGVSLPVRATVLPSQPTPFFGTDHTFGIAPIVGVKPEPRLEQAGDSNVYTANGENVATSGGVEAFYGRRLVTSTEYEMILEIPVAYLPRVRQAQGAEIFDPVTERSLGPAPDYKAIYVTPRLLFRFPPASRLKMDIALGGGYARFTETRQGQPFAENGYPIYFSLGGSLHVTDTLALRASGGGWGHGINVFRSMFVANVGLVRNF